MTGLANGRVFATVAVSNRSVALEFYADTLGLKITEENVGGIGFECGGGHIFVYVSDTAGTGSSTAAMWEVEDVAPIAAELAAKGVPFDHYDLPECEIVGDVHQWDGGAFKNAWFRDPDGNILGIVSGSM
jgi:catechol 2,3-dioxygenase-like lactoylglutathione lyase family enzyme